MNSYLVRLWYAPSGDALIVDEGTTRAEDPEGAAFAFAQSMGLRLSAWGMFTTGEPSSKVKKTWAIEVES